ncbi:MAG: alkylation response protein AidB-like acyl-CoA dehydrogenase [Verrucomicrobiales bacterium]|jgi:alkylation response protein AidB-like acyl-CoA dehydrogenase
MNTLVKEPETKSVIDTSKMNKGERAALEMAEAARDETSRKLSFAASFFMGAPDFERLLPFPIQSDEDRKKGDVFIGRLRQFLLEHADPDEIDREGEIPDDVLAGLRKLGAFGIKIPKDLGGLGLSQTNYSRAAMELGGYDANLTALLSAHQSIGVPQPLIMFGTDEQKKKYLPRCAAGEISAFALTEPDVGSDPAKMKTSAVLSEDGKSFILNGEKLWCTNGVRAGLLVVMARTGRSKITAFIVEADWPGVEVVNRCRFMGLKALYNGVMRFTDVVVPKENIILAEGKGLKVALSTLNTGRITLPAGATGMSKRCLDWCRDWASRRVQWGAPIGRHDAIAQKLARMAADTFAMESMTLFTSALVDESKKNDIRLEAAFGKLFGSERGWRIIDDTMQIRGGRGYETADSLRARGDEPVPVERFFRDARINTIFEGSSEIMRLFIAREALDPHLKIGGPVLNSTLPMKTRFKAAMKSAWFYLRWYPKLWLPRLGGLPRDLNPQLRRDLRRIRKLSQKLARRMFHSMIRFGPKLEKKQVLLGRFVDIGAELFAMSVTCARTQALLKSNEPDAQQLLAKAEFFCEDSRARIGRLFMEVSSNADNKGYALAKSMLR